MSLNYERSLKRITNAAESRPQCSGTYYRVTVNGEEKAVRGSMAALRAAGITRKEYGAMYATILHDLEFDGVIDMKEYDDEFKPVRIHIEVL